MRHAAAAESRAGAGALAASQLGAAVAAGTGLGEQPRLFPRGQAGQGAGAPLGGRAAPGPGSVGKGPVSARPRGAVAVAPGARAVRAAGSRRYRDPSAPRCKYIHTALHRPSDSGLRFEMRPHCKPTGLGPESQWNSDSTSPAP